MNNRPTENDETELRLARIFAQAKPRPMPPAADRDEIHRAVLAEWEAVTGRRMWRRRGGYAAAASVLIAAGLWLGGGVDYRDPVVAVAHVERVHGVVTGIAPGETLVVGQTLATGAGQLAVRFASGGSLRLGALSEVQLTGQDAVELVAGVLYFDSEAKRPGAEFMVTTALGTVRDVGTQFLVKLEAAAGELNVGVRDGRVVLTRGGESATAEVGERLVARQAADPIRREAVDTFGSEWEWVESLAPPFAIDGRTVSEFLVWFAEQTGRRVVFGSLAAEKLAREARLRGSIDLEPLQKLSAVLALTDLTYVLDGDRVVIDTR